MSDDDFTANWIVLLAGSTILRESSWCMRSVPKRRSAPRKAKGWRKRVRGIKAAQRRAEGAA